MRILICDDDEQISKQLHSLVWEYFIQNDLPLPEIVFYSSGDELLKDTGKKDLVLLDIEMPGVNGIYVGNELKKQQPNVIIIIVTSYAEYLDDAMRFHVFRYLSKPVDKVRFFRNMTDALRLHSTSDEKIAIETKTGIFVIPTSEIVCVEAILRKVIIHTTKQDYISPQPIQYWLEYLTNQCFVQSHRSFIVNLAHVSNFDTAIIHLHNNQITACLARRKYAEFKAQYLFYLESTR